MSQATRHRRASTGATRRRTGLAFVAIALLVGATTISWRAMTVRAAPQDAGSIAGLVTDTGGTALAGHLRQRVQRSVDGDRRRRALRARRRRSRRLDGAVRRLQHDADLRHPVVRRAHRSKQGRQGRRRSPTRPRRSTTSALDAGCRRQRHGDGTGSALPSPASTSTSTCTTRQRAVAGAQTGPTATTARRRCPTAPTGCSSATAPGCGPRSTGAASRCGTTPTELELSAWTGQRAARHRRHAGPGATITGTVTNAAGAGLGDICVERRARPTTAGSRHRRRVDDGGRRHLHVDGAAERRRSAHPVPRLLEPDRPTSTSGTSTPSIRSTPRAITLDGGETRHVDAQLTRGIQWPARSPTGTAHRSRASASTCSATTGHGRLRPDRPRRALRHRRGEPRELPRPVRRRQRHPSTTRRSTGRTS